MNDARRKELAKAAALVAQALEIVTQCRDDEQEYLDNMPESFRYGEKGEAAQTCGDTMDSAVEALEQVADNLTEAAE